MVRQTCLRCDTVPQDVLVLQCEHTICLGCATALIDYMGEQIRCYKCCYITYLDSDIVEQLRPKQSIKNRHNNSNNNHHHSNNSSNNHRINKSNKNNSNNNNYHHHHPTNNPTPKLQQTLKYQQTTSYNKINSINNNSNNNNNNNRKSNNQMYYSFSKKQHQNNNIKSNTLCKYHSEYQIMYLCKDCNDTIACPECVIHGSHKGHIVISIKKFINDIEDNLNKQIKLIDQSAKQLLCLSNTRTQEIRDRIYQINKLKTAALNKFSTIRLQISKQQNNIMQELEHLLKFYQQDIQQIQRMTKQDIDLFRNKQKQIEIIIEPLYYQEEEHHHISREIQLDIVYKFLQHQKSEFIATSFQNYEQISNRNSDKNQVLEQLTDRVQGIRNYQENIEKSRKRKMRGNKQLKESIYCKLEKQNIEMDKMTVETRVKSRRKPLEEDFLIF